MSKFTPGPWTVEDRGELRGADVRALVGGFATHPMRIANVVPFPAYMANANLIAAAPEMYEALKGAEIMIGFLLEYAKAHPHFEDTGNANITIAKLKAALAKADGGQQ